MFSKFPMYQNIGSLAYKKDLSNIKKISHHLGNPHKEFKSIHIAGTNGKGSCAHMLSSVLQEKGLKVGLYTSPHLLDFRERVRINGEMISKDLVLEFILKNFNFFELNKFSFFEMTVGLAFDYFRNNNIDIAIIEAGMGGRLDSTNIICPLLSIITNISIDHTKFLGTTNLEIAKEKGGIIKENIPVVIGETHLETKKIFIGIAKEKNSEIVFADSFDYEDFDCDLKGNYQMRNIKTVLKSIDLLNNTGYRIENFHIKNGLKNIFSNTGLRGRRQILEKKPMTICDTAHNEAAIKEVVDQLLELKSGRLHFIIGFSNDKDIESISKIFPQESEYYFVEPNIGKAMQKGYVKEVFERNGKKGLDYSSVNKAFTVAKTNTKNNDIIFIGGSTFVVAEIL